MTSEDGPRIVKWLREAQHFLAEPEEIADIDRLIDRLIERLSAVPSSPAQPVSVTRIPLSDEWKATVARNLAIGRHGSDEPGHRGEFETCSHAACEAWRIPAPSPEAKGQGYE